MNSSLPALSVGKKSAYEQFILFRAFLFFLSPILARGFRFPIQLSDIIPLPSNGQSENLIKFADLALSQNSEFSSYFSIPPSKLGNFLFRHHRREIFLCAFLGAIRTGLLTISSFILLEFLKYLTDYNSTGAEEWRGILLVCSLIAVSFGYSIMQAMYEFSSAKFAFSVLGEISVFLFNHILKVRTLTVENSLTGPVSSNFTSDLDTMLGLLYTVHDFWLNGLFLIGIFIQLAVYLRFPVIGAVLVVAAFAFLLPAVDRKVN